MQQLKCSSDRQPNSATGMNETHDFPGTLVYGSEVRFTSSAGAAEVGGRLLSVAVRNLSVTLVTQPLPSSCPLQS
jgi:hypothetical protein